MFAEASTVLRAVAADFFCNCWYLEIPSDNRIRHIPRCVQYHAQGYAEYADSCNAAHLLVRINQLTEQCSRNSKICMLHSKHYIYFIIAICFGGQGKLGNKKREFLCSY
jgi:hypothetical protein